VTGYPDSATHVRDELARADLLVRAQVEWFRHGLGAVKSPSEWGLPSVGETEVTRFLARPGPVTEPEPLPEAVTSHLTAARDAADRIAVRVRGSSVPLRLPELVESCGLDQHERDVLLLCLLSELDDQYRRIFGYLADDATIGAPTAALALRTVAPELTGTGWGRSMFAAGRPLAFHRLVEVTVSGVLRIDPRIAGHLLDDDTPDDRVAGVLAQDTSGTALDELVLDTELRDRLRRLARSLATQAGPVMVLLHGPYGSGRHTIAAALCTDAARPLLTVDVRAALREPWPRVIELCYREAVLRGAALCWTGVDPLLAEESADRWSMLVGAAASTGVLTLITAETAWDPAGALPDGRFLRIDLAAPGFARRRELWQSMLPPDAAFDPGTAPGRNHLADLLANTFQLTAGRIVDAVASAHGVARVREPEAPLLRVDDLYEGCRRQSGRRLVAFATRIEPRTELTFGDLVLPPANRRQLEELRGRIALRGKVYGDLGFDRRLSLGRGVVAMFTGGSGTGKTMAAELLAREQGADLYKVDLSAVASKYVGETEKNLDHVFEDAEQTNAMIFFDEADALFAKRGEVKEARDRWANVEMAFLLQRVEEYRGVVILASNLRQNIDNAFLRRLHAVVDFPAPDPEARLRIWRGMFPAGLTAPSEEDLSAVAARFPLSGGSIRNVVLDAAFRALQADSAASAVDLRDLTISVGREYQKLGLPVTPGEFGQPFYGWVEHELLAGESNGR
jgi:AAA+ superfamily predicted ATPase